MARNSSEVMYDRICSLAGEIFSLRDQRNAAWRELCEREASERTACSRSNGVPTRFTWQDIARERGYTDLLPGV
ncbi:hypothetical protein UFOVP824_24 [uncultured Caudovirales phage]|uniref:Uncharacterized protein n=1 Tax=uncultured Caudovirales phage TaxID=2100421 RepID=A0A6J5PBU0_9CAUD|nr:hypothetical protein UFOVP824_24 [uncultured Caudovirales phage]